MIPSSNGRGSVSAQAKRAATVGPRASYGIALHELAKKDDRVCAVSADLLKSSGLERFERSFPQRTFNCGIAEQAMIGFAGGLAFEGLMPFTSSFAPFVTMRALEQIRMAAGYMGLPIKLVGLGSGFGMESLGVSHYGLEDIAVLRTIPNVMVLSPADCLSIGNCLQLMLEYDGPSYLRLTGIPGLAPVYDSEPALKISGVNQLEVGSDVALLATGAMVGPALEARAFLIDLGLSVSVYDMYCLNPLNCHEIIEIATKHGALVTIEEHFVSGGLGSAVLESLNDQKLQVPLMRLGIGYGYPKAGSYQYLLAKEGLTPASIARTVQLKLGT